MGERKCVILNVLKLGVVIGNTTINGIIKKEVIQYN